MKRKKFVSHFLFPTGVPRPDIYTLQETHSTSSVIQEWMKDFRGKVLYAHGAGRSRGVMLGFSPKINCKLENFSLDTDGRFIVAHVRIFGEPLTIVSLYLDPSLSLEGRERILAQVMEQVALGKNARVVFCGDFNTIVDPNLDVAHPALNLHNRLRPNLQAFLEKHDLTDVWRAFHDTERQFTCYHSNNPSHIDYILASPPFLTHVTDVIIGCSYLSDHAPLYLEFSLESNPRGRGFWRMPSYLLSDVLYQKRIRTKILQVLRENDNCDPVKLWDLLKCGIRGETIKYMAECSNAKKIKVKDVDDRIASCVIQRDISACDPVKVLQYSHKLKLLQIEREEIVSHASRQDRLFCTAHRAYEFNRPTRYYFRLPGCKYDSIKQLRLDNGSLVTSDSDILKECHSFYNKLYTKPLWDHDDDPVTQSFLDALPRGALSEENFALLDEPLSIGELRTALFKMQSNSPGMDGFTVEFYKEFWDILGPLLHKAALCSFEQGILAPSQRRGLVRLLPKLGRNPLSVQSWRPITLLGVDYKVITKVLAARLSVVLNDILHHDQRGFIRGRYIGDNVMEIYSLIANAQVEDEEGMLLLLDIEKAFDSVSWGFLHKVMVTFGFPESFCNWIRIVYREKEIRILNNGHASDSIFPTNGVAQGCGLLPLLFVLTIEALACSIRQNSDIVGYTVGGIHKKLALLADDMILSLKARQSSFDAVLSTLVDFAKVSNLAVNYSKSTGIAIGKNRSAAQVVDLGEFQWLTDLTFKYLGVEVLVFHNPYFAHLQKPVAEIFTYIDSVLLLRNHFDHVLQGCILNVRTFVASKLMYYFSLAPSPSRFFMKRLQNQLNNYVWSYRKHMVSLQLLSLPHHLGGLNMYSVVRQNCSLKLKWISRLLHTQDEFWKCYLVNCFHFPVNVFLKFNMHKRRIHRLLKDDVILPVFWLDVLNIWFDTNFCYAKDCTAEVFLAFNSVIPSSCVFNVKLMQAYHARNIFSVQDFLDKCMLFSVEDAYLMRVAFIHHAISKKWPQGFSGCKAFLFDIVNPISVHAINVALVKNITFKPFALWERWQRDLGIESVPVLWSDIVNKKFQFLLVKHQTFYWKYVNRAYYNNYWLSKIDPSRSSLCTFCNGAEETFMHLYWNCPLVYALWIEFIDWCRTYIDFHAVYSRNNCLLLGFDSVVLNIVMMLCKYFIHTSRLYGNTLSLVNLLCCIKTARNFEFLIHSNLPYLRLSKCQARWGLLDENTVFDVT